VQLLLFNFNTIYLNQLTDPSSNEIECFYIVSHQSRSMVSQQDEILGAVVTD
jgi:hypothetical protein